MVSYTHTLISSSPKLHQELASAQLERTLLSMKVFSEAERPHKTPEPTLSAWTSCALLGKRLNKTINKTQWLSLRTTWPESKTLLSSKPRKLWSKKRNCTKNRSKLPSPSPKPAKPRWLKWTNSELKKSSQKNGRFKRKTKLKPCSQKHRKNWTKTLTM